MKRPIKLIAVLLLLSGAGFSAYRICDMALEYRVSKDTYERVQQAAMQTAKPQQTLAPEVSENKQNTEESTAPVDINPEFPIINFELLKEQNNDTVGWVYIEGTNINYPVVQSEDNRHYVSTMFDGKENRAGSIFMDYLNNADMSDVHTIIYGHNMRDKSMFADILNFQQQEYLDAHPTGIYITPEANYRFDIIAAYVASLAEPAWQLDFVADDDILAWIKDSLEKSTVTGDYVPSIGDRYITLSTCSYEFEDARFVLVGVLNNVY